MAKQRTFFICQQCGFQSSQYLGRCPQCDSWNSFVEQLDSSDNPTSSKSVRSGKVMYLDQIQQQQYERLNTDIEEFNRVLGGGIVKGSIVLVAGDPGIGKSTLLTQLALNIGNQGLRIKNYGKDSTAEDHDSKFKIHNSILYIAGEESAQQIKMRVDRIQKNASLPVLNEVDVDIIIATIKEFKPSLVIVDSIQTLQTQDLSGVAGSVGQVRECSHRLQRVAKEMHIPIFVVGHVTKEGTVAGPKTLEHLVDVVLNLEGDTASQFRILRAVKNRFGSTDEVGVFEMYEEGMKEIQNPSELFLETKQNEPGSVVVPIMTGLRPILVEIQALVTKTNLPIARRVANGIDNNRLQLLVATLQKRLRIALYDQDVFINVTGGLKIAEPAADLGICIAIISSFQDKAIPKDMAFVGEIGLLGELRRVNRLDKRVGEAKKLGYKNVISSDTAKSLQEAMQQALRS